MLQLVGLLPPPSLTTRGFNGTKANAISAAKSASETREALAQVRRSLHDTHFDLGITIGSLVRCRPKPCCRNVFAVT